MKIKPKIITYDKEADAMYVYLRNVKVARTQVLSEHILIDLDKNNIPIGVEILDASRILRNKVDKPRNIFKDKRG
ncbi:MAG: DUF2283 domain-containing protein, partial [Patescibacteria group bacterium]